jgi:hypothetical protein
LKCPKRSFLTPWLLADFTMYFARPLNCLSHSSDFGFRIKGFQYDWNLEKVFRASTFPALPLIAHLLQFNYNPGLLFSDYRQVGMYSQVSEIQLVQ